MPSIDEKIVIGEFEFRLTCFACPEQYDVYSDGQQVGYVRLRGGMLRVDFPDCGAQTVLEHEFEDWQGCFDSDEERQHWLQKASEALRVETRR